MVVTVGEEGVAGATSKVVAEEEVAEGAEVSQNASSFSIFISPIFKGVNV